MSSRKHIAKLNCAPRGFSLLELLAVIAVVAALLAIALPVMSAARDRGRHVRCLAQMRGLAMAVSQYGETMRTVPVASRWADVRAGRNELAIALADFVDATPPSFDIAAQRARTGPPWLCPSDREFGTLRGVSPTYQLANMMLDSEWWFDDSRVPDRPDVGKLAWRTVSVDPAKYMVLADPFHPAGKSKPGGTHAFLDGRAEGW